MAGISISELINKEDIIDVPNGFIPISINDNTFKIQASTFLTELTNRTNNFETVVEQQSATITQCITDTVSLCASIECNDTDITNLQSNVTNIYSCLTDLSGCVDVRSLICETDILRNTVENNGNAINNVRTRFTTLSSCVDTINGNLLLKASASTVDNLLSQVNSLDSCVENESNKIVDLQSQINALDVCGNAIAVDNLSQRITKNETDIGNNSSSISTLNGCVSEICGKVDATATASCVNSLESRITTTEGVATGAANSITTINNEITTINGTLAGKANSSAVNSLASSIATESSKVTSLQTLTANLQTQITNIDVGSQASAIGTLQSQASTADSNITQLQTDTTTLNSCIGCVDGCISGQASSISTLQSNVNTIQGSGTGSITQACSLATTAQNGVNTINAKYGVQLNTCGVASGFCLNSSGGSSDFIIATNCFILADQNNASLSASPFSVIDNCVRMCGACIKDLTVDTLQIGEKAISSAAVVNSSNFTKSVASHTNRHLEYPLGTGYESVAQGTIVSAGCPTVIQLGYQGDNIGTQAGSSVIETGYSKSCWAGIFQTAPTGSANNILYSIPGYTYSLDTRLKRTGGNGDKTFTLGQNNTFLDDAPGTGAVTYTLEARFKRNLPATFPVANCRQWYMKRNLCTCFCPTAYACYCAYVKVTRPGSVHYGGPIYTCCVPNTTQSITLTDPFIEIRQQKR